MVAWKVAASLDVLLGQLNAFAPRRSKISDGGIGDAAHMSRSSDHNPWFVLAGQNLVTARDFTDDSAGGLSCERLAATLRSNKDARVKYVIWNRRIMAGYGGPSPWIWRPYAGSNPHTKHLHLSVVADARCLLRDPWNLAGLNADQEDDVDLSQRDIDRIADAVLNRLFPNAFGDYVTVAQVLNGIEGRVADVQSGLEQIAEELFETDPK